MNDIDRAKEVLNNGEYTCVLVKGESLITSTLAGIAPMAGFLSGGMDMKGYSAADKIIGKAAAMLFVLAQVKEVFAPVMSAKAADILDRYGILYSCTVLTDSIVNRQGTGPCPMDRAVKDIEDPHEGFKAVMETLESLKTGK